MPTSTERQLAHLRQRFEHQAQDLGRLSFLLKGSLLQRRKQCNSPGCACHSDPAKWHGPYWQWTSKLKGKTLTRVLTADQVRRYRAWMDNARRFEAIVQELYAISTRADQLLSTQERPAPQLRGRASRRRSRSQT